MKQGLVIFFLYFVIIGCGGTKIGIPKIAGKKADDLDYGEYIQSKPSTLPYNERVVIYVKRYNEIAKEEMRKYKIPASITLAQGILESGAGNGTLALKSNNHFGIKCHKDWKGSSVSHDDNTSGECFRKYKSPENSFEDHSRFLVERQRYAPLFKLNPDDYKAWALGLKSAGYATDPKYPAKLIRLIETFGLDKYDEEVLKKNKKKQQQGDDDDDEESLEDSQKTWPSGTTVQVADDVQSSQGDNIIHVVQKGDTLYSISKKYKTSVDDIRKINNLGQNTLSIGQKINIKVTK